jgi:hypothetical protein
MITLIANIVIFSAALVLATIRPGFGFGMALALGRHTLPDRNNPIVAAAPLFILATALGIYLRHGGIRLTKLSVLAPAVVAVVTAVGYFQVDSPDSSIRLLATDKATNLALVLGPLLLLTPALADKVIRADVYRVLIAVPALLMTITLATGSVQESSGRAAALGGGPITLSTAAGFAVIVMVLHPEPLWLQPFDTMIRLFSGAVFLVGMIVTDSRQPLGSLMIIIGVIGVTGAAKAAAANPDQLRRQKRIRALSFAGILGGCALMYQLIFLSDANRFQLLANPAAELERSRLSTWRTGWDLARTGGPLGNGFGATFEVEGPEGLAYPHNFILELLSEVGLFLGVLVLGGLVVLAVQAWNRGDRVLAVLGLYAFLGTNFSGDFYNSRYFFVFLTASAIVGRQRRLATVAQPETRPELLHRELVLR